MSMKIGKAFTLAEVLITLGVIGVVAALTLPALIQNYKKHVVETRLKHFYTTINQALNMAKAEHGDFSNWNNLSSTDYEKNLEWVNLYLRPYIEITETERSGNAVMLTLKNGSMFRVMPDRYTFYPNKNKTELQGRDCFAFQYSISSSYISGNRGFEPYTGNYTSLELLRNRIYTNDDWGCKYSEASCRTYDNRNKFCTKAIEMNGWKIPENYPIRF